MTTSDAKTRILAPYLAPYKERIAALEQELADWRNHAQFIGEQAKIRELQNKLAAAYDREQAWESLYTRARERLLGVVANPEIVAVELDEAMHQAGVYWTILMAVPHTPTPPAEETAS